MAGEGSRHVWDVLLDIEVGIIKPCRWRLTEGTRSGSSPQLWSEDQPAGDETADVGDAELALAVGKMPAIEDSETPCATALFRTPRAERRRLAR